jgi:uncharacterized damage-inducible protein DinB
MNFYGAKDLASSFRTVRKNTLLVAQDIGEEHYGFSPASGSRTVAQLLIHIAMSTKFAERIHGIEHLSSFEGFNFQAMRGPMMAAEQAPHTKAQIITMLQENGDHFANWLDGLTDEFLAERMTMMPGQTPATRTRFDMILSTKEHEMHHRGQLMLIERMVGVVPHLTREMQARMAAMASRPVTA